MDRVSAERRALRWFLDSPLGHDANDERVTFTAGEGQRALSVLLDSVADAIMASGNRETPDHPPVKKVEVRRMFDRIVNDDGCSGDEFEAWLAMLGIRVE